MVASKYSLCDMEIINLDFELCSLFKHSPTGKGLIYDPNGGGTMTPMEYNLMFIAPIEKAWFYEKLFFEVVIVMVKDKKIEYKRYNNSQT